MSRTHKLRAFVSIKVMAAGGLDLFLPLRVLMRPEGRSRASGCALRGERWGSSETSSEELHWCI